MKRFAIIILAFLLCISADKNPQQKYIEQYSGIAVKEMERTGVPASITLAQGLVESNSGQSVLAVKGNNHFGIKCHNDWKGRKMYHDDDRMGECFRVYPNAEQSFRDHSDFLRYKDRYKSLFDLEPTNYKAWAHGLKKAGYATDPAYATKLIRIIEDYDLQRFDNCQSELIPEAPLTIEAPKVFEGGSVAVKKEYKEEHRFSLVRKVMSRNGVPFIVSVKGETYESIALEQGLFLKELLSYNDLKSSTALEPGTEVFIRPKKARAEKGLDKYIIDHNGEDLREIAQRFAVKLSSIMKINALHNGYVPEEGDTIKLR